ncbi:MAG: ferritin [Acidobacteriota bacterium]|nr:ferritin [Acidobacteriota bacterium]
MSLHPEIAEALNRHATVEASSAFIYFSMASWFDNRGLKGFANWCHAEAQGEMNHMTRFFDYINTRGHQVKFGNMDAPPHEWSTPLELFEQVYQQELALTAKINELVRLAQQHADHATDSFLNIFIMEQIEDEAEAGEILAQIKMVGDNNHGLLMISNSLANRKAVGQDD